MLNPDMHCSSCGRDTLFEQPPADAQPAEIRSAECDEWLCTVCGTAMLSGPLRIAVEQVDGTSPVRVHRAA